MNITHVSGRLRRLNYAIKRCRSCKMQNVTPDCYAIKRFLRKPRNVELKAPKKKFKTGSVILIKLKKIFIGISHEPNFLCEVLQRHSIHDISQIYQKKGSKI